MESTRKSVLIVLAGIALALVAAYVWPTQWVYHGGGVVIVDSATNTVTAAPVEVRTSRFSNRTQYLTLNGFQDPTIQAGPPEALAPVPPPMPLPEPEPTATTD